MDKSNQHAVFPSRLICSNSQSCGSYDVEKDEWQNKSDINTINQVQELRQQLSALKMQQDSQKSPQGNILRQLKQFRPRGFPCLLTQAQIKQHVPDVKTKTQLRILEVLLTPDEISFVIVRGFGDGPWEIGAPQINKSYDPDSDDPRVAATNNIHREPNFSQNKLVCYDGSTLREPRMLCFWELASKLKEGIMEYYYVWVEYQHINETFQRYKYYRLVTFDQQCIVAYGISGNAIATVAVEFYNIVTGSFGSAVRSLGVNDKILCAVVG